MLRLASHIVFYTICIGVVLYAGFVWAGNPSGADTFELTTNLTTGSDNTGDGGTGDGDDLNYYYVGQSFVTTIAIKSGGTTAANIWIDYNSTTSTAASITDGNFFNTWSGQTIDDDARGAGLGRVYVTGSNIPVVQSSGTGTFGTITWTANQPSAAAYATSSPETLDINVGVIGNTTESNISLSGNDLLDDEEDFQFHIWADTVKPFAENPSPSNGGSGVSVTSNYTFDLRDTLRGEGNNSGVGTGVNTTEPPGSITFDDGDGAVDYTGVDSFSCSGIWGTNLCAVTVNPTSPSGIGGDSRNWEYNTSYTVTISGFRDKASADQDALGDANGPNTMDAKVWTFTTETDSVAPQVSDETPTRASTGVTTSTNIIIEVEDRKAYPNGASGVGLDASTCNINVSSDSFALTTFAQGDATVTVAAIDYGYRYTINPATDFAENETVSVSVYDCEDDVGNEITTDTYTFSTADTGAPYVDTLSPAADAEIETDGTVSFHIKDSGTGVDIDEVVIYLNGNYYTNGGGTGTVTSNGTAISYSSSLDFNGGNYVGDTTSVDGTSEDYTFVLDPELDFTEGEAIPILIYAQDATGNLMERYVYALAAEDPACPSGSTYCGENTNFEGGQCVGTGGGDCAEGSTYCGANTQYSGGQCVGTLTCGNTGDYWVTGEITNVSVAQVDETSVLVTWNTNGPASSRVVFDTQSHESSASVLSNEYRFTSGEVSEGKTSHSVLVTGLTPGTMYYFRPVSRIFNAGYVGDQVRMAPKFGTRVIRQEPVIVEKEIACTQDEIPTLPVESAQPIVQERIVFKEVIVPYCDPSLVLGRTETNRETSPDTAVGSTYEEKSSEPTSNEEQIIVEPSRRLTLKKVNEVDYNPLGIVEFERDEGGGVIIEGRAAPETILTIIVY
ncbi:fibronectin type III domain-containing protein [Candidatus Nomurabacteria bacterium]|nr:fibronectin type III domain-containing protein [Candidatus Nomurabacteria bacterium]